MVSILDSKLKSLGIYIHIPYCRKKCRYCDFLSYSTHDSEGRAYYTVKLVEEIVSKSIVYNKEYIVDTIFIGGGTPSLLETEFLEEIVDALYSRFNISKDAEITIESNPGTIEKSKLSDILDLGINRLSIGIQSLNDGVLRYLGRIHDSGQAIKSIEDAKSTGFTNINTDMMVGIPGQTAGIWQDDFKKILELKPEHVSFYSLQLEENTPVFSDVMEGRVEETDPIIDRKMYHDAIKLLDINGYRHYEISNAALSGFESRHNLKYWSMDDYLGLGLGAHSMMKKMRFCNTDNLKEYLSTDSSVGFSVPGEPVSKADHMSEYIFLGLRKTEGILLSDFEKEYGRKFLDLYRQETENLVKRGLLEMKDGYLKLTELGLDLSNQVFREYV